MKVSLVGWAAVLGKLLELLAPFLPPDRDVKKDVDKMKSRWNYRRRVLNGDEKQSVATPPPRCHLLLSSDALIHRRKVTSSPSPRLRMLSDTPAALVELLANVPEYCPYLHVKIVWTIEEREGEAFLPHSPSIDRIKNDLGIFLFCIAILNATSLTVLQDMYQATSSSAAAAPTPSRVTPPRKSLN